MFTTLVSTELYTVRIPAICEKQSLRSGPVSGKVTEHSISNLL